MPKTEIPGKFTPERNRIAFSLRRARFYERTDDGYTHSDTNGLYDYLINLGGLRNFLEHARKLRDNGILLDIGAGITIAASELRDSSFGKGFKILATGLTRKSQIDEYYLGNENLLRTSVERLEGIEDGSVSAALADSSVAYSGSPSAAVKSIDRVLLPGGLFKGTFAQDGELPAEGLPVKAYEAKRSAEEFKTAFLELGYDVISGTKYVSSPLLLAIKPGGTHTVSARELFDLDDGIKDCRGYRSRDHLFPLIGSTR